MRRALEKGRMTNTFYLRVLVSVFLVVSLLVAALLSGYVSLLRGTSIREYQKLIQTSVSHIRTTFEQDYKNAQACCENYYGSVDGVRTRIESDYAPTRINRMRTEMFQAMRTMPYVHSFIMLNQQNELALSICSPETHRYIRDYEQPLLEQLSRAGRIRTPFTWQAQSRYADSTSVKLLTIYFRENLPDEPGYKGTACINIDMEGLSSLLFSQTQDSEVQYFILDSTGTVVAHTDSTCCGMNLADRSEVQRLLGGNTGFLQTQDDLELYAEPCADGLFYVAAQYQPLDGVAKERQWILSTAGITVGMILLAGVVLYVVCALLFKPFNAIIQGVKSSVLMQDVNNMDDLSMLHSYHDEMTLYLLGLKEKETKNQIIKALLKQHSVDELLLENQYIFTGIPYYMILVHLGKEKDEIKRLKEYDTSRAVVEQICTKAFETCGSCTCFDVGFRRTMILVHMHEAQQDLQTLNQALERLCEHFRDEEKLQISVYISSEICAGDKQRDCAAVFQQGESCLRTWRFMDMQTETAVVYEGESANVWKKHLDSALACTKLKQREKFQTCLDEMLRELKTQRWEIFTQAVFTLAVGIARSCGEEQLPESFERLAHEKITNVDDLNELVEWLLSLFDEAEVGLSPVGDRATVPIMEKAVSYIDENYGNNALNLNYLADYLHISAPYLGKMFRSFTGSSFNDYILKVRMTRAKELLLIDRSESIMAIAEKVGYANNSYFTASFKKYYGVNPSQYRAYQDE